MLNRTMALLVALLTLIGGFTMPALAEGPGQIVVKLNSDVAITVPESVRLAAYKVGSVDELGARWMDPGYESADCVSTGAPLTVEQAAPIAEGLVAGRTPDASAYMNGAQTVTLTGLESGIYFIMKIAPEDPAMAEAASEVEVTSFFVALYRGTTSVDALPKVSLVTKSTVVKHWEDAADQDGLRDDAWVTVQLLADGAPVEGYEAVTLTRPGSEGAVTTMGDNGDWVYTVTGLPKYLGTRLIDYKWVETAASEGYAQDGEPATADGVTTITNRHEPEITQRTVIKVWEDKDNQDGVRPDHITVYLMDGENVVQTVTLSEANNWTQTVPNLAKNRAGEEIVYTWREGDEAAAAGYDLSKIEDSEDGLTTTLTNSYTPGKTQATIIKVWDDKDDQDGKRPDKLNVYLLKNGERIQTVTLSDENGWTATIRDLDKATDGVDNVYTWEEDETAGYTLSEGKNGTITTFTNTHVPEVIWAEVEKEWVDDEDRDGLRPASLRVTLMKGTEEITSVVLNEANNWHERVDGLPLYENGQQIHYTWTEPSVPGYTQTAHYQTGTPAAVTTLTNHHTPETIDIPVTKVWTDDNNRKGKRPERITVQLMANGKAVAETLTLEEKNRWTYTWTGLKKYENGELINYSVVEVGTPSDYSVSYSGSASAGFTVTNTYTPGKTSVSVEKQWVDDSNRDGMRPTQISVQLLADGAPEGGLVTLNAANQWKYTWNDLDEKRGGVTIDYTIAEVQVAGYTGAVKREGNKFILTNTHTPLTTRVDVSKVWDDDGDRDGIRPASIRVDLKQNGEVCRSVTLDASNGWRHSWDDLPVNIAGVPVTYTVEEPESYPGYTPRITGSVEEGFTVTNTHTPETTLITVIKRWNNEGDANAPSTINVQLYADGVPYGEKVTLTEAMGWIYTWPGLPKKAGGRDIAYTVQEDVIPNYIATIVPIVGGFEITNTYTPGKTQVNVHKVWADNNDQDGIRPEGVTVHLLADGEAYGSPVTLNAENSWSYTWSNLDAAKDGALIRYTVSEDPVDGYLVTISGSAAEGFEINNTHTPETTSIDVTKTWDDGYNRDGLRPYGVTVQLLANGSEVDRQVLLPDEDGTWPVYTWRNLPANRDGQRISYTVNELNVSEGYTATVSGTMESGFVITNTHVPQTTRVAVSKVWRDEENADGIRPASITVNLLANGTVTQTATLNADNQWEYTFRNLPVYDSSSKRITYSVTEPQVAGYTTTITGTAATGFIITNTHEAGRGALRITKVVTVGGAATTTTQADGVYTFTITGPNNYQGSVSISIIGGAAKTVRVTNLRPGTYTITETGSTNVDAKLVGANGRTVEVTANNEANIPVAQFTNNVEPGPTPTPTPPPYNPPVNPPGPQPQVTPTPPTDETPTPTPEPTPTPVTSINAVKVWDDEDNVHGLRPSDITVQLLANGTVISSSPIWNSRIGNNWSFMWTDLPAVDETGMRINYTVREQPVEGYTTIYNGTTITNRLIPQTPKEYTNISGTKTWNDNNNEAGDRPNYITVHLLRNGADVEQRTVTAANGWQYSFNNLPLDDGYGLSYTYSIREDPIAGYFQRYDGFNITNTRLPEPPPPPEPENPDEPPVPRRITPPPPFEEQTEEELEELLDLFDYGTPLFGILPTGDDMPIYPFIFGGIGLGAIGALLVLMLKSKKKGQKGYTRPQAARR